MTMTEPLTLLLAWLAGGATGAAYFAGLWWTLRRSLASDHAAAWLLGSGLLRLGITLLGFHLAGGGQWQRLLACLAGFVLARSLVLRLTRRRPPAPARSTSAAMLTAQLGRP